MNTMSDSSGEQAKPAISAPFFICGELVEEADTVQRSRDLGVDFAKPKIDLDRVVHPRTEVPPLLNVPLSEIIDFLVETGQPVRVPIYAILTACRSGETIFPDPDRKSIGFRQLHRCRAQCRP